MSSSTFFDKKKINSLLLVLEEEKLSNKYWNISWQLGIFLSNLVLERKPKNILEIGTSNGFSTLWMAKSIYTESRITTIEVNEERFNLAKKNFKLAGIEKNITQLKGEVFEVLDFEKFEEKFDLIFLDAAHKFYREVIESLIKKNLMDKKCTIICDNIISHPYMGEFVDWMKTIYEVRLYEIDSGFLIASKK